MAREYFQRLTRSRSKLFTFLEHDSVPWNNNSAEHALKQYAYYRKVSDGQMMEAGLTDYLVLLSVYQTCRYKGVSFFRFLLSGERDVDRFIAARKEMRLKQSLEVYPEGFSANHRKRKGTRTQKASQCEVGSNQESTLG